VCKSSPSTDLHTMSTYRLGAHHSRKRHSVSEWLPHCNDIWYDSLLHKAPVVITEPAESSLHLETRRRVFSVLLLVPRRLSTLLSTLLCTLLRYLVD
jgi:hypothetical protein